MNQTIEVGTDALVHALHSFLSKSYHDLSEMGNNGRCLVEEKYSSVIIAKKMIKLYEKIK